MEYSKFKKYLINKNILLFDAQYRVAFHRLIDLTEKIENEQYGGSKNKYYIKPFFIIKNSNKILTNKLIQSLLYNKKELSLNYCTFK